MENSFSALHFATQSLHWPLDGILTFGRSIGTGPAVKLASLFCFAGVILVTPFLSVADLFKDRVGPLSSLFEEWYPNIDLASRIKCPVLLIHGKADSMIGFHHAELLYAAISTRKLLVSPAALSHNTNLMNDVSYLILPATHFFSLPDYVFHDLQAKLSFSWVSLQRDHWLATCHRPHRRVAGQAMRHPAFGRPSAAAAVPALTSMKPQRACRLAMTWTHCTCANRRARTLLIPGAIQCSRSQSRCRLDTRSSKKRRK